MSSLRDLLEGKIDFHGQKKADDITRMALISSTILSFILGLVLQSLRVTMGMFTLSTVAVALVVLPPWPVYNKHLVKWQPTQPAAPNSK